MSDLVYYAWHAFAYAADTSHLSREADYAYRRILDEIFRTAQDTTRIKDDDQYLRAVARASTEEWAKIREELIDGAKPLLSKRGKWIFSARLRAEVQKAQEKSAKARASVAHRTIIERSTNDDRTMNDRSSNDPHINININTKKEESKNLATAPPKLEPRPGAELSQRLRDFGLPVSGAAVKVVGKWESAHGAEAVIAAFAENASSILDSRVERPFAYFASIVKAITEKPPAAPERPIDAMQRRVDEYECAEPVPLLGSTRMGDWLAGFEANFGFTFDQWREVYLSGNQDQAKAWLGVAK